MCTGKTSSGELKLGHDTDSHIAFFLPNLAGGGAEKATVLLANAAAQQGKRVDVVVMNSDRSVFHRDLAEGVNLFDLGASRPSRSAARFAGYLREHRPDEIHSQMFETALFAAAAQRLAGHKGRLISTIHSTTSRRYGKIGFKHRVGVVLASFVHRHLVDEIVAVSHGVADDFAQFASVRREKIKVIYNPVDPAIAVKALARIDHPWFVVGEQIPVVLGVGSLRPEKGFDTLIRAFAQVHQEMPSRLLILGEGALRKDLERLVAQLVLAGAVDMPGFVENPYPYMAKASVFALSSTVEGYPLVLAEALGLGAPCVSTDCESGPREILQDGALGTLVPVGDVNRLAEAIKTVIRPGDREQ